MRRQQQDLFAAFAESGIDPDVASEIAWDPAMILVDALRRLPLNPSALQLRDSLAELSGYAGVNGIYDFQREPQRGLTVENAVATRWNKDIRRWDVVSKPTGVPLDD